MPTACKRKGSLRKSERSLADEGLQLGFRDGLPGQNIMEPTIQEKKPWQASSKGISVLSRADVKVPRSGSEARGGLGELQP